MDAKEMRNAAQNDALAMSRRHTDDGTYDYIGLAAPGTGTDEEKWRIARINQSTSDLDHPQGSAAFAFVWDNVLTYSYS